MYTVAALYHFTPFPDPAALKPALEAVARAGDVTGTLLLATEGINGTIGGPEAGVARVIEHVRALPGCDDLEVKYSAASERPFARLKVRLKKEIVTIGQEGVDPRARTGHYVEPAEWNEFIRQPDVAVIDTRNDYEVAIGTLRGRGRSEDGELPRLSRLVGGEQGALPQQAHRDVLHRRHPLREIDELAARAGGQRGLPPQGRHPEISRGGAGGAERLAGRVLRLRRAGVGRARAEGRAARALPCLPAADPARGPRAARVTRRASPATIAPHETSAEDKARFRERQRQIGLARARGETHLARDAD